MWACVTRREELYEQSISNAFMKLMRFICKENSAGRAHAEGVTIHNNDSDQYDWMESYFGTTLILFCFDVV